MSLPPTTVISAADPHARSQAHVRLRGPWLATARAGWVSLVGLVLVSFVAALPLFYRDARITMSPDAPVVGMLPAADVQLLQAWGLSLTFYAAYQTAQIALFALIFTAAGALLFWRKSDERMALFVSLWFALLGPCAGPALDPLIRANSAWELPIRFLQGATLGGFPIFTYLFPDGRFVPRWTRFLTYVWIAWIVISPFTPYAVANVTGVSPLWFGVLVPGGMGIGILAQVYRYWRVSGRVQRQQTKWVLLGFLIVTLGIFLYSLVPVAVPAVTEAGLARVLYLIFVDTILLVMPFWLLLLCVGIAILRYRLWDVDYLINRTLVYGSLTLSLTLVYVGSVIVLQQLLRVLTGQATNEVAIVASTLAIAAIFQPLRTRIQATIDRRFYRRKYNVAQTLQAFSAAVRDEVDLNVLADELVAVVNETMQPAHCSLWLRDGWTRTG